MKRSILLPVFIAVATLIPGLSNSQSIEKETRDLAGFTRISFGVSGDLYINFGDVSKVVLEGDKALLADIVTEVSGVNLVIKKKSWKFSDNKKVTVYITMNEMTGLGVSGSGKAEIKDAVDAKKLELGVSGSGKILTSNVSATDLNCSISGSGDIIIGGNGDASDADISISGSGSYKGESMKIGSAEINISGSGNCSCNVTESLRASVSGSGNVSYLGNPKLDARVSGSGKVRSK